MNNNSSKQILLSVIGVAILVVAVVGVSFAFFNYTRVGETTNQFTTGKVTFTYADGQDVTLTNVFPVTNTTATAEVTGETPLNKNVAAVNFSVSSDNTNDGGVNYYVYLLPSDSSTLTDSVVNARIVKGDNTGAGTMTFTAAGDYGTTGSLAGINALTGSNGVFMGSGNITGTASATFELRLWVDDAKVLVSDTTLAEGDKYDGSAVAITDRSVAAKEVEGFVKYAAPASDAGKYVYSTDSWNEQVFSVRILVEAFDAGSANDTAANTNKQPVVFY